MLPVNQLIRFFILLLVIVSGGLLGTSLSNFWLALIAIVTAFGGYLITDRLKWFRLGGLLANIASVLILVIAMKDFFPEDSTGKLISVAHLLIYLQALLMFQEKTPRLVWQILMLSLLQAVVAAIFSLGLEGGVLFVLYFIIAGVTLTLQMFFAHAGDISSQNKANAKKASQHFVAPDKLAEPIFFFDPEPRGRGSFRTLYLHLGGWLAISLAFTLVLFYMIPRTTAAWVGGAKVSVTSANLAKSLDLLNNGEIKQTHQTIFRAVFEPLDNTLTDERIVPSDPPYFRGMALSDLVVSNGHTNWRAPHDRISSEHYQFFSNLYVGQKYVRQIITMEESPNPLFYSTMPFLVSRRSEDLLEYCHEISALVRCRLDDRLELAPFKYELLVLMDEEGRFADCWPYLPNANTTRSYSMEDDPEQEAWLTKHHPQMYPTLVSVANQISGETLRDNPDASRRELCKALEGYFVQSGRFSYTLDYRNVKRSVNLDPNEDFMRNHRTGHCEMFASALALMLRSRGIPARVVVGFYGGETNALTENIVVRGRHAHAWVEAYLRPEDCSEEMFDLGIAGPGGAWLRLDPTPPSTDLPSVGVGTEAIDFARTIWQEYVLGMSASNNPADNWSLAGPFAKLIESFQTDNVYMAFMRIDSTLQSNTFRYVMVGLIILPPLLTWLLTAILNYVSQRQGKEAKLTMRKILAKAVSLFSPKLGKWILTSRRGQQLDTAFYDRMARILAVKGLAKSNEQTHRDFAKFVGQQCASHPQAKMISSVVYEISEIFYEVRFGRHALTSDLNEQIQACLNDLEKELLHTAT